MDDALVHLKKNKHKSPPDLHVPSAGFWLYTQSSPNDLNCLFSFILVASLVLFRDWNFEF